MATNDIPGVSINYQRLVDMLPSWLERKDDAFKAQIPNFINLAENRIATDMKQEGFQSVVEGVFDLSNVLPKPSFWRETISFTYKVGSKVTDLKLRTLEYVKKFWPDANDTDLPLYFADYNINHFYIAPTPPEKYAFELVYYARLQPLTIDHQENWLTLNAPQTLFYATLLEAAMWCKNPAAEQKWMQQYQIATGGIINEDNQRAEDRNARVK